MKRTESSDEMHDSNWFFMIVWLGMILAWAVFIYIIDKVITPKY